MQARQSAPPQSMPVSSPSFSWSAHSGMVHTPGTPEQVPLPQSAFTRHTNPRGHGEHISPPQSVSDSSPSNDPSSQLGSCAPPDAPPPIVPAPPPRPDATASPAAPASDPPAP